MSGLLRRLAQQVVGPIPNRVHARTRRSYETAPRGSSLDDDAARAPDLRFTATSTPARDDRADRRDPRATGTERGTPPTGKLEERLLGRDAIVDERPVSRTEGAQPASAGTLTEPGPAPLVPPTIDAAPFAAAVQVESATTSRGAAPVFPEMPAPIVSAPPDRDPSSVTSSSSEAHGRLPTGESRATRRTPSAQTQSPDEPGEVHVHIGRIEVTAVREAAPTKRKGPRGKPPMSLDEYLARRQRGGG